MLFFFPVVVISVDAKNKALNVLCIGLHTRREKFFHQIIIFFLSQKVDMSNHCQKTHPCWLGKALHMLGLLENSALCNSLDDTL